MSNYDIEVKQRWGQTEAYKEHAEKTANYTADKWQEVNDGLNAVIAKFAECLHNGNTVDSDEAQALVKELQDYITENYYTCTNEILAGLGQMYVADERFKNNIDKQGDGAAEFISDAIKVYCSN
ncbi:MAG: TipAS antibiotic-recognition domain-containing protein [Clostridia bacterium]|nr:TipAS antibiotic-recognition domain-containing protein [Clostridia bacterium]